MTVAIALPTNVKAVVRDVPLEQIKLDQHAQPRDHLNTEIVQEYAEAMAAGAQFPPLVVFFDGKTYWLADGFHRHYAALSNQIEAFPCDVHRGGLRDAILFSCGANAVHGYKRSNADKRHAVMRLLQDQEWRGWSDREIARQCNVSTDLVGDIRRDLAPLTVGNDSERTYTTKHGTTSRMDTSNIGQGGGSRGSQSDRGDDRGGNPPPSGPMGSLFGNAAHQEDKADDSWNRQDIIREEPVWTPSQEERKHLAEQGTTVVASMRDDVDSALIEWAKATGRMVRIDRMSQWGNPYEMPGDGDRATVIESYKIYFDRKFSLHRKSPDLCGGKVLVCWCHPEPCHGDFLCNEANKGEGDE